MKIYKDKETEVEDLKSTGWSFSLIGSIGLIALILFDTGIIPISLLSNSKITISIVMGALFIVFLFVGIHSFLSVKKVIRAVDSQTNFETEILDYFKENYVEELNNEAYNKTIDSESDEPDFYYYSEKIGDILDAKYPVMNEDFRDYMIEKIYNVIFPE